MHAMRYIYVQGQASDIAIQTNEILTLRAKINELYVKHTGQSLALIGEPVHPHHDCAEHQQIVIMLC